MRSLRISLALFAILLICIIINVIFIHSYADKLDASASELSSPDEEKLCRLEEHWSKNKKFIGLSISENHLDSISKIIVSIRCAYEAGDDIELKKNLALLADASDAIRRYEKLSPENIF